MNEQLLTYFEENRDRYLSGEELSRSFNCSRTAIWKHIRALRKLGYEFEAIPRIGYRLKSKPQWLDSVSILSGLKTKKLGKPVYVFKSVDSTQNKAHQLQSEGAAEGALIVAEEQTAGRGRMGRQWHSPPGKGIWMSLILRPRISLQFTPQLTLLVAVALCRSIRQLFQLEAQIKWPNDVLVNGKKISGILLESKAEDERLQYVVVGIGISVNLEQADYPAELLDKATSIRIETGREIDRAKLIQHVLEQLEKLYELYQEKGFEPIRTLWESLSMSLNHPIQVETRNGKTYGIAESIDELGGLAVRTKHGDIVKIYSGDVRPISGQNSVN